jgi:hypothetical protein
VASDRNVGERWLHNRSYDSADNNNKSQNEALEAPGKYANAEWRHGVAYLLELVLFETKNYKGFSFQDGNSGRTDASKKNYF